MCMHGKLSGAINLSTNNGLQDHLSIQFRIFCGNTSRIELEIYCTLTLMEWSYDGEHTKMLLDIPSQINNFVNDQLALNLVDIIFCVDDMPDIAKIIEYQIKITKIWLVEF